MVEFHMTPIRNAVYIPYVWEAFDESGNPKDAKLESKLEFMFQDLSWWGNALKTAREKGE